MNNKEKAYELLKQWKGDSYVVGLDVLNEVGKIAKKYGSKTLVVSNQTYMSKYCDRIVKSLEDSGVEVVAVAPDVKPNAPREDVYRLVTYILQYDVDSIIAFGGGSTIDACKCANVLKTLGKVVTPEVDHYFGTGVVTKELKDNNKTLLPLIAIESSASSGAHLTKYSNITDPVIGQKKLIVDEAIIPRESIFDYSVTKTMPIKVTIDGALDAIAHTFEVFCGAKEETFDLAKDLAVTAISLCAEYASKLIKNPQDLDAREAIGLATDLGGYAIMIGGTSGAHLTSFSLVDLVGHGTACGIMNPYYAILFTNAIQPQLKIVGKIFKDFGYTNKNIEELSGRELSTAVANAMLSYSESINAPTSLNQISGFNDLYITKALEAAKDPQLKMKLQNMPIPMKCEQVDVYMKSVLVGASVGDLSLVKEL